MREKFVFYYIWQGFGVCPVLWTVSGLVVGWLSAKVDGSEFGTALLSFARKK